MVEQPWVNNVRFTEFTPTTIHYDFGLDAYFVARADIRSTDHHHRLRLIVSVTMQDLTANRVSVGEAITWGRTVLERLVAERRNVPDSLTATEVHVFNLSGERVR